MTKCKYPSCDKETRDADERYGEEDQYRVGTYGAKFCITRCELKYDHIKADARDAKRDAERKARVPHPEELQQ